MTLILNGTTGLSDVDGTAAAPAIRGTDADTGLYFPTANEVAAAAGGVAVWNAASSFGFKNRVINGACVIDQRNSGSSITANDDTYAVDRFKTAASQSSKLTAQRNAGSVTPPAGFSNYLGYTSSSAYSVGSSDYFVCQQGIEGFNTADLAWGTANAQAITLSFWVRSSLTGTFGGSLRNASADRSYPFTYTISAANTWEQKTVNIAGDTSGTWGTGNGIGISLGFGLGVGSTLSGTAGSWAGANYRSATGATSVVGTNGATWYITGVQLEKGSTATSFDFRSYGTELALCQRYFEVLPIVNGDIDMNFNGFVIAAALADMQAKFAVTKRAAPTMTLNNVTQFRNGTSNITPSSGFAFTYSTTYGAIVRATHTATLSGGTGAALIGGTNASIFASIEL
jgi:hypothetical protein